MLDPFCRTHDVENLFVVDASFFPSSAAVNPGLTIVAQALRVADHITATELGARRSTYVRARSFSHVGITVSDFNRAVQFYWDVFGCPLVGVADTPPERVRSVLRRRRPTQPTLQDRLDPRARRRACSRSSSSSRSSRRGAIPWNRVGLTHISLQRAQHCSKWHDYLVSKGVECVSKPERSPRGHSFFFAKDFDGNLIEMIDLGYMYYVLQVAAGRSAAGSSGGDVQAVLRVTEHCQDCNRIRMAAGSRLDL